VQRAILLEGPNFVCEKKEDISNNFCIKIFLIQKEWIKSTGDSTLKKMHHAIYRKMVWK